ncbi:phosphatidylinositol phosphatase PTPRQ-like isoform X2 [Macrotis lagotis]|uniref:phosphatidylinositol phosphatase PTPRQ-like isoform X2 n=1 Tax=Macrotis lagotis TaxID=92651 RepID=UPI003D683ECF
MRFSMYTLLASNLCIGLYICHFKHIYIIFLFRDKSSLKAINVTETSLEYADLENNIKYNAYVTASTRFGDGKIKSNLISFRTPEGVPSDPPKEVHYANLTSSSIILFWDPPSKPNGIIQYYSVYYQNNSGIFMQNFTLHDIVSFSDNMTISAVIENLAIFSYYVFWVTASTSVGNGNKTSDIIQVYTDQDIPEGLVENLTYETLSSTAINVSWFPPSQPNGLVFYYVSLSLQGNPRRTRPPLKTYERSLVFDNLKKYTDYILKVTPATEKGFSDLYTAQLHIKTEEDDGPDESYSFTTSENSIILDELSPFTLYSFFAAARTRKGLGPSSTLFFYTDEAAPLAPPQNLTIINCTSDSVWLTWNPSPLPSGIVKVYNIKIHENGTDTIFYQVGFIVFW